MFRISFLLVLSFCFLLGMATKAEVENLEKEATKETIADSATAEAGNDEIIPLSNWQRSKKIDDKVYKIANELEEICKKAKGDYEAIGWNLSAVRLIKKLDELGKDALPAIYDVAKDKNRNVELRKIMMSELGFSKELAVIGPMIDFLLDKSEDPSLRYNAADLLGRILKNTTATPALIKTMEDKSNPSEIRSKAAWAIFSIRDKRAIAPLLGIVQTESDEKVKRAAIAALGSNAYAFKDTSVTPIIIEVVKEEKSSSVRMMGYECLGTIGALGDDRAVSALVDVLKTEGPNYYIIKALGISKSYKAKQVLKELLSHKDESVRFDAAKALLKIGDKSVISEIEKVLPTLEVYQQNMISDSLQKFKNR